MMADSLSITAVTWIAHTPSIPAAFSLSGSEELATGGLVIEKFRGVDNDNIYTRPFLSKTL